MKWWVQPVSAIEGAVDGERATIFEKAVLDLFETAVRIGAVPVS